MCCGTPFQWRRHSTRPEIKGQVFRKGRRAAVGTGSPAPASGCRPGLEDRNSSAGHPRTPPLVLLTPSACEQENQRSSARCSSDVLINFVRQSYRRIALLKLVSQFVPVLFQAEISVVLTRTAVMA